MTRPTTRPEDDGDGNRIAGTASHDANVVPIGTRGRPGRGNRRSTPSSAARSLAAGSAGPKKGGASTGTRKSAAKTAGHDAGDDSAETTAGHDAAETTAGRQRAASSPHEPAGAHVAGPPPAGEGRPESDQESEPGSDPSGVPAGEWLAALLSAARSVLGDDWEVKGAELLAQVRRRITGEYEIDEFGLDPQIQQILLAAMRPIAQKWFRTEVRGAENIPADGGALIVANHSGTIPIDAGMTSLAVHDHAGRDLRLLGADLVFALPFVGEFARKTGATLACNEDAERLLAGGHIAGVWPEGFKGIGKSYAERYKLQRFGRGGFVSAAMRAGVPIVPVSIVGAEEIYPLVGNIPSLARLLGVPYIPITPFFPWLGPLGTIPLPSKWIIEFGEPVRTDAYDSDAADDPMLVFNVTDQVRETIQQTLYALLVDRGHPFF